MEQNTNQKDAQKTLVLPPRNVSKNNTLPITLKTAGTLHSDQEQENELIESSSDRDQTNNMHSNQLDGQSMQSGSKLAEKQWDYHNRNALPLIPQPASSVLNQKLQSNLDNSSLNDMDDEDQVNDLQNNRTKNQQENSKNNAKNDATGWKALAELDSLPLMKSGYSLEADMKFGWKPQVKGKILPIPFVFDSEDHLFNLPHFMDRQFKNTYPVIYQGMRPADSFKLYKKILSINHPYHGSNFKFRIPNELPPAIQKLIDQQMQAQVLGGAKNSVQNDRFEGMNSQHKELCEQAQVLKFDSMFESGNLDRVVMVSPKEYDLYMRPDTNTRGHHQWFFFLATAKNNIGAVKFNIINFTKPNSLYDQGMKVCICSCQEKQQAIDAAMKQSSKSFDPDFAGWKKAGYDISYQRSKLNDIIDRYHESNGEFFNNDGTQRYRPTFYQMSFTYDFNYIEGDQVYFAHSFPYTFTKLTKYLETLKSNPEIQSFVKDQGPICHSLSGIDIPYLVVTSRVNQENFKEIMPEEHAKESQPEEKMKKVVYITSRVHPGETNASFMVEGFLNFITSLKDPMAQELRKRIIFKIIPCINPDGVMAGNYRVSMSGNDLNRRYLNPHTKLHPVVCAVKKLIKQDQSDILAFIDMHGHSRKKNVFMYGPEYPIHDNRYLQMRILPKLMSEQSQMFRYYSCKFRIQPSKEKTARVVLWREFNIMNCYTLEASLHGFFDQTRDTTDFLVSHSFKIGKLLGRSMFEYMIMKEEDEKAIKARRDEAKKQKLRIQQQLQQTKKTKPEIQISTKVVLSPSASSEAFNNIDDQQPNEKSKLNQIRKKLLKAQSVEKNSKGQMLSNQKEKNNNKKFKLTKKFKDDIQVSTTKKSQANPMEPTSEPEILPNPNEDQEMDRNDFVAQYKMNKRTLKDLCNQIETEEKDLNKNSQDEGNQSDRQQSATNEMNKIDDSGSEEDVLLQEIHGNILGIIDKSDQAQVAAEAKKKPKKLLESSSKKPPKTAHLAADNRKNKDSSVNQAQQKQKDYFKTQKTNDDKKHSEKKKQQMIGNLNVASVKPRADRKGSGQGLMRRESSNGLIYRREPLHPQVDPKIQLAPAQSQIVNHMQQNLGQQQVQINYNNFNDRIINQSYHKHKKGGPQFGTGYHLATLSANAQQLLQHQLMQEKAKREKMLDYQKSNQKNSVDQKAYAMYNFQPRTSNKIEPLIENNVFSLPPKDSSQTNDHRYKLTSKQFNKRTNIDEENIDHINHQKEMTSQRQNQQMTRGPTGFMVTNSQEKQLQISELEKASSQININRTSQHFNPINEQKPLQSQQNNENGFKKRNRRIKEQQKQVLENNNSQNRFVVLQPNQLAHQSSYQQVMVQSNQQQIQANNLKQYQTQQHQIQSKAMNAVIKSQHGGDQNDVNWQRMSAMPIFVQQENRSIMKVAKNALEPSSAGPIIEGYDQNNQKLLNENKYQFQIEKDTANMQGRISMVTQKMTNALFKENGQSRTAPMSSQLMSFSISTQKDQDQFQNRVHKIEPQVYESASKNRNQFHQFYPNPLNNNQGANEAYGLPQKQGSPKNIPNGYDDIRFNTFATPMKQQLGQPRKNGRTNNNQRNDNLTTGSKLGLPSMTYTTHDVPKFQLPNDNEFKRVQDQQMQNYIDLRTPQQNTKSESAGYNKRNQMPVRHQLSKAENKQYYHQFGERSVPNFEQINEIQVIRNGETQLPLTMKTSVANQSQTSQKPVRNTNLIAKEAPMFNTRQFKSDNKPSRKDHKFESKSQQKQNGQRINTSLRQNQGFVKPHEVIINGKHDQESLYEISQDLEHGLSQHLIENRQRNLDQKCFQFIKSTSKRAEMNSGQNQKEVQSNLYSVDHRRVNFIKNQIKSQQEQYHQDLKSGLQTEALPK